MKRGISMDKGKKGIDKYNELFGDHLNTFTETDPDLMLILKDFIFGEVFFIGNIDDRLRELITIAVLTTNSTLPQLKAHIGAALNIEVTPIEIKEAIYQCTPFMGFPKVLNAVAISNEVFSDRGIKLPLQSQKQIEDNERFKKGVEIQFPIYGDAIKKNLEKLPEDQRECIPRFLTELCFGDFYTRSGIEIKVRELLILCVLCTLGGCETQIKSHVVGNLKVGNSRETIISAITHCLPYVGFPRMLNAINIIKDIKIQ